MADTKRTLADLLSNIFQDGQAINSITAQDIRDLIVSFTNPHGSASMEANATATTIAVAGTYALIAGTFVAGGTPVDLTESTVNGKLTYTGIPNRHFHIVSNLDVLCASNNQVLSFQWFKNGVAIGVPVKRKVGTGTDIGAVSIHADATLSTNDYLELRVTNDTSTATVTVQDIYAFVMGVMHG